MHISIYDFESVYLLRKKEKLGKHFFLTYACYIMIVAKVSWDHKKSKNVLLSNQINGIQESRCSNIAERPFEIGRKCFKSNWEKIIKNNFGKIINLSIYLLLQGDTGHL